MRKTKIVCTIGPASETIETLVKLIEAGMNVARLNFSHGSHEEHAIRITNIREAEKITGKTIAILLDTKGPEIRTHRMVDGAIELEAGKEVIISMQEVEGTPEKFSVSYEGLIDDVRVGSMVLLDDGLVGLEVLEITKETGEVRTKILNGGPLKNNKGVNLPGVRVNLPGITEKDAADIKFGIQQHVDYIAASFVRRSSDVKEIYKILEENYSTDIKIISKIENQEGIDNIHEILKISDGLMVARGDMGVEIPAEEVPIVQKALIRECNRLGKPVITATQMLDSMQRNPRPTRAEASDVANAIFDGTDAIMLSGETAAGMYPVESVITMDHIAVRAEEALPYDDIYAKRMEKTSGSSITDTIGQSVVHTAYCLDIKAIVTPTMSGYSARMISKYRPKPPILAITPSESASRKLALVWGVFTDVHSHKGIDQMFNVAAESSKKFGFANKGDLIVITTGVPYGQTGSTNLMHIHIVDEEI